MTKIQHLISSYIFTALLFSPILFSNSYSQTFQTATNNLSTPLMTDTIHLKAVSEGFNLDGVILKKISANSSKLPAVIFIVGSGEQSLMESYRNFMQFFFEKTLLEAGFAIIYFDKRGLGNSEGIWYETTFEQRALDAKNVALEVQKYDFIDKHQVYVIGHSQGGWIVQIALANYPEIFAGGISMAGPTFGVKKQMINDYKSGFLCKGFDESKALKKAEKKVNRILFFVSMLGRKGNLKQLKVIKDFEPEPYIRAINRPLLLLFAGNDPLVSPAWSIEELDRIFPDGLPSFIKYYTAQGENHSFKVAPKCYDGNHQDIHFSEATRNVIFEWLVEQSITY